MYKYNAGDSIIKIFWSSSAKNSKYINVYYNSLTNASRKELYNENGYYFLWNNKRVYIEDYMAPTIEDVQKCIKKGEYFKEEDLFACIRKYKDEVKFIMNLREKSEIYGPLIISSDQSKSIECIPYETKLYPKDNWEYKIVLVPKDETIRDKYISETLYSSDLYTKIIRGTVKMLHI